MCAVACVCVHVCELKSVCETVFVRERERENVYACVCCERVNEREIMKNCVFVCVYMGMSKCKCA